ncbi:sulfatase-like hydrolase/transferase [uncultured Polaribacter sp.]|uniref:sulfatase-like hydrolase/transferase n=1 Tax=uncultured Polaribacter sp. TaxID=174711 RepID=UPI002639AEB1|nr:sulfatase-like hydrolase/transferase [uncultured Polaribacter sp.]
MKSESLKSILFFLITISSLFVLCRTSETHSVIKNKPNVLIILVDDLGYGDISSFGQKKYKTPNIDKIGTNGVSSTSFYVPTPYCAPSRATLLTGRFPLRHRLTKNPTPDAGVEIDNEGLHPDEITIPEIFKKGGYISKAIGKWHLGHKPKFFPVAQGFDEYYGILYSNDMRPVQIIQNKDTIKKPVDQRFLTTDYTEKAIEFIKRQKENPFLLYLAHAMPHKPLAVSDKFYTPETPNDLYADVIRELDYNIGKVMATLEELKILDNTIVIFMSDNGPWYGGSSGGFKGMKATTWEGGIRVPFMIQYPKVFPKNKKIDIPLWSPDILPTLCTLTNIELDSNIILDGKDITSILQGKNSMHAPIFSMHNEEIMSVRKGKYKLFLNKPRYRKKVDLATWSDPRAPDGTTIIAQTEGQATPADYPGVSPEKPKNKIQLFDLEKDPTESKDLASLNAEIVKELMLEYKKFKATF